MVMYAADLFRSLAPISGNIYDIDPSLTKGGKPFCVDGICIDTPSYGKGLFLHHGVGMYEHAGHFNRPSFNEAFPFAKEVIKFFARDSCGINSGVWNETINTCECPEKYTGTYCLSVAFDKDTEIETTVNDEPEKTTLTIHQVENDYEVDLEETSSSSKRSHTIGYLLFVLALLYVLRKRYQRDKKKNDSGYSHVMDRDIGLQK